MKHILFLLIAAVLGIAPVQAQTKIVINEVLEYMSAGEKTGFEVAIVDSKPADVQSNWSKYLKKNYKAKVKSSRKSPEAFADNALISAVSDNTIDIYSIAASASYGTRFLVFVDLGGAFISSQGHEMAFGAFKSILHDFALSEGRRVLDEELGIQEKVLKDLQKELESLTKEREKYQKEIEKAKALIATRETEIQNSEQAQATKRAQVAIQEQIIETVKQKQTELNFRPSKKK